MDGQSSGGHLVSKTGGSFGGGVRLLGLPLWIGPVLVTGTRLLPEYAQGRYRFDSCPFRCHREQVPVTVVTMV